MIQKKKLTTSLYAKECTITTTTTIRPIQEEKQEK
jgi:hypothetical protein